MPISNLSEKNIEVSSIRLNGRLRQPNPAKVDQIAQSIAELGLLHPLILSSDHYLMAGGHRYEALKKLGVAEAKCNILPFLHDDPEAILYALEENLMRNELTVLEQAEYLLKRKNILEQMGSRAKKGGQPGNKNASKNEGVTVSHSFLVAKEEMYNATLNERTIQRRLQIARNLDDEQRSMIHGTPLANEQKELLEIAHIKDPERRTGVIRLMVSDKPPQTVNEAVRLYRIETGEITVELDIIKPSNWWAFGRPKWQSENFPGSIPGEVYANALYYFAPDTGIAADGMAGSGMFRRVYSDRSQWQQRRKFGLDIRLYDLCPREPFATQYGITRHDMRTPLPEPVDWLFIDPPYFKISSDFLEGELAKTTSYARYLELMTDAIRAALQSLNVGGRFCLFITPYLDISQAKNKPIDVPADLRAIAIKTGFIPVQRVYVSRGEQQRSYAGMMNLKAKASQRMFSDVCEMMVFSKAEVK